MENEEVKQAKYKELIWIASRVTIPRVVRSTTDGVYCAYCGVAYPYETIDEDDIQDWIEDECNHSEGCAFRRAVEFFQNIDNEGYWG